MGMMIRRNRKAKAENPEPVKETPVVPPETELPKKRGRRPKYN